MDNIMMLSRDVRVCRDLPQYSDAWEAKPLRVSTAYYVRSLSGTRLSANFGFLFRFALFW